MAAWESQQEGGCFRQKGEVEHQVSKQGTTK